MATMRTPVFRLPPVRSWAVILAASVSGALAQPSTDDGEWTMAAKDYQNLRYSSLDEITTENVDRLQVAWTFSTGLLRGHEAAPLVVGTTMYLVTPYPNILYALDLEQDGAIKWM